MKKFVVCLCLSVLGLATCADSNINLTQDVRAQYAAGHCDAPTITGAGHPTYPYSNAFDGISVSGSKYRWLSAEDGKMDSAWAQFVAPANYAPGSKFMLTSYRVHRLFAGQYDTPRSPKKWEILGVLPNGTTEVIATQTHTWGTGNDDATRIQTFSVATDYKYRGFQFHPLETSTPDSDNVKFGLLEVEFIVSWVPASGASLLISSSIPELTGSNPAVGAVVSEDTTCTAPLLGLHGGVPYDLVGYTIETWEDDEWTGGSVTNVGSTYSFTTATPGIYRLTWCYEDRTYNLVPTFRSLGLEPTVEGNTAGADWPVANVFDGLTHVTDGNPDSPSSKTKRWLCKMAENPYVKVSVDRDYHPLYDVRLVAYRIWRLYDQSTGWERAPTAWTIKGVRSDTNEEETLDAVSDVTWTKGSTDAVRMKTFTLPIALTNDFRTYTFVPTANQASNDYVGMFEIEFIVKEFASNANSLTVASADGIDLDCTPIVGEGLVQPGTCTRTSKGYLGTSRYAPAGYKLYRFQNSIWTEIASDPTADTYVWDGTGGELKLEWQWGVVDGYKVDVSSYGQETFTMTPAGDARSFYDIGTTVSVVPIVQTDPASTFVAWVGDVAVGCEKTIPLVLTSEAPKSVRGEFTRAWKFVPDTTEAKTGTFTDGNWSYRAETDTVTPAGDYKPDLMLPANAYLAGHGVLDMSTLPTDTGRRLTSIVKNGSGNHPEITGLILPSGLAYIGPLAFSGCANLAFVEMPDTVLKCNDGNSAGGDGGAFGGCPALVRVKLSNAVTYLGHQTFGSCSNLVTVTPFLPQTLTYLGSAFQRCISLTGTPELVSVKTMANGCFYNCIGISGDVDLTGVTLSSSDPGVFEGSGITSARGVENLSSKAFYYCSSLTNVNCAAGITEISSRAFAGCFSLSVISSDDDFACVRTVGRAAFSGVDALMPCVFPALKTIESVAFWGVSARPNLKLTFPSVTSLADYCFDAATLAEIDFRGSTFTTVEQFCFRPGIDARGNMGHIETVILPESVNRLATQSFYGWTGRRRIRFCGLPPTTIDENAFPNCDEYKQFYVYVPQDAEKLAAWKACADFVALADIPDVETKPGWDLIKDDKHLIGAWRKKWCFTWNPNPKSGLIIFVQ